MRTKTIVLYKSSTGFTKKYAELIAKELRCALADYKTIPTKTLSQYDCIIFGSRAFAGTIDGFRKAQKRFKKYTAAKLILFVTGATPNTEIDTINTFWSQNLTADELIKIPHFYMQGGLCYEKMALPDKLMMKMAALILKKKKNKTSQDKEFEQAITHSYDISSEACIQPLIMYLNTCTDAHLSI